MYRLIGESLVDGVNITNLRPNSWYRVHVVSNFASGQKMESMLNVKTTPATFIFIEDIVTVEKKERSFALDLPGETNHQCNLTEAHVY